MANKVGVLILQHPQEQDVDLGTARLTALYLKNAVMKVGLSWPNLAKALGRDADPKKWAVLYLGSASAATEAPGQDVVLVDKKGKATNNPCCEALRASLCWTGPGAKLRPFGGAMRGC